MTTARDALREEFKDPIARHDYAQIFGDSSIALQIKSLRLQRGLSQKDLAALAEMKQSRISAMEQASYSSWSIRILRRMAKAFDLALVVRFESFGHLLDEVTAPDKRIALERPSFPDDPAFVDHNQKSRVVNIYAHRERMQGRTSAMGQAQSMATTTTIPITSDRLTTGETQGDWSSTLQDLALLADKQRDASAKRIADELKSGARG
jgi:transcriptional regulator with XRE-family HTH domain